jgi:hypothetical protein
VIPVLGGFASNSGHASRKHFRVMPGSGMLPPAVLRKKVTNIRAKASHVVIHRLVPTKG